MKGVKLEDVTGEKAVRPEPVRRPATPGEAEVIGRPKTAEEQMDDAAGQVAWAIVACFGVAVLLLVNALTAAALFGMTVAVVLLLAGIAEAVCGWLIMQKRSRTAAVAAICIYAPIAIAAIIDILLKGQFLGAILHGIALGAMGNGVSGILTYHRLAKQVDHKKMSDTHIKDVFGDGDETVKENA